MTQPELEVVVVVLYLYFGSAVLLSLTARICGTDDAVVNDENVPADVSVVAPEGRDRGENLHVAAVELGSRKLTDFGAT